MPNRPHPLYGLIGQPIDRVRSPALFNASLAARGLPGVLSPMGISAANLAAGLAGLRVIENLVGFLVTMPHKLDILPLLDEVSLAARISGAVNIVRREADGRLVGGQLDGAGFVAAMGASNNDPAGKSIYVIGAGGVSAGICAALAEGGAGRVVIHNRTAARVERLAQRLEQAFPHTQFAVATGRPDDSFDVVINATSVGALPGDAAPANLSLVRPDALAADVVTMPPLTPHLAAAQARGCKLQYGDAMIHSQIELMHAFFAG